jgi:hypothetical protein
MNTQVNEDQASHKNSNSSQSLSEVEKNAFTQRELANETIEQEAEVSDHTEAGIANEEEDDD